MSARRGCDGCGRDVRPYRFSADGDDPMGLAFCFLCVKEGERDEGKRLRAEYEAERGCT